MVAKVLQGKPTPISITDAVMALRVHGIDATTIAMEAKGGELPTCTIKLQGYDPLSPMDASSLAEFVAAWTKKVI